MDDKLFYNLWKEALTEPDKELYVMEHEREISGNILDNIHDIAHMTVRDLIAASGLTKAAFARKFCIPIRTVEEWAAMRNPCVPYIRLMMAKELGLLRMEE